MRVAVALSALAVLAAGGRADGTTVSSGITGTVIASPVCPVETVPPQPQCAPRPIAASLRVRRYGRTAWRVVRSGDDGRFRVRLVPAVYRVQPLPRAGSPLPRPPAARWVRVRPDRFTTVTFSYDTGIR